MSEVEGVFDVELLHKHIAEQQRRLDNAKHLYEAFKDKYEQAAKDAEQLRAENAMLRKQLAVALGRMGTAVRRASLRKCAEDELAWLQEAEKLENMIQIAAVDAEMVGLDWKRRRHAAMNPSVLRMQRSLAAARRNLNLVRARMRDMDHIETLVNQLCVNARQGNLEAIQRLILDSGVNIHETDEAGLNALHYATMGGHLTLVRWLLENGADVHGMSTDHAPLVLAAKHGHLAIVQLLHEHGALVDAVDATGVTPLAASASQGHVHVMRLLIEKGASVNAQDIEGSTPLHLAIDQRRVQAMQLLLQAGADVSLEDIHGHTAKNRAFATQDKDVIEAVKPFIS